MIIKSEETVDGLVELHADNQSWRHYLHRPRDRDYYILKQEMWRELRHVAVNDVYMTLEQANEILELLSLTPPNPKVWRPVPLF
jgi:hypothetical protein